MPEAADISRLRSERDAALARAIAAEDRVSALDRGDRRKPSAAATSAALARLREQRAGAASSAGEARDAAFAAAATARSATSASWLQQTPEEIVGKFSDRQPIRAAAGPPRNEIRGRRGAAPSCACGSSRTTSASPRRPTPSPTNEQVAPRPTGARVSTRRRTPATLTADAPTRAHGPALATRHGAYRAGYIVTATDARGRPTIAARLRWCSIRRRCPTEPPVPRADALPDRFVVLTYSAGRHDHTRSSAWPIPDDLALAPDAAAGRHLALARSGDREHRSCPTRCKLAARFRRRGRRRHGRAHSAAGAVRHRGLRSRPCDRRAQRHAAR